MITVIMSTLLMPPVFAGDFEDPLATQRSGSRPVATVVPVPPVASDGSTASADGQAAAFTAETPSETKQTTSRPDLSSQPATIKTEEKQRMEDGFTGAPVPDRAIQPVTQQVEPIVPGTAGRNIMGGVTTVAALITTAAIKNANDNPTWPNIAIATGCSIFTAVGGSLAWWKQQIITAARTARDEFRETFTVPPSDPTVADIVSAAVEMSPGHEPDSAA
jgi:hypothetical protein